MVVIMNVKLYKRQPSYTNIFPNLNSATYNSYQIYSMTLSL
jgi:hypothetical protein